MENQATDNQDKYLDEVTKYSNEQFDKNTLFIASGALGVSFAFIKDIIPNFEGATHKGALLGSWYIFAGVIFISLISHFILTRACDWAFKNENLESDLYNCKIRFWNIPIRILNITSIISILVGSMLLIYFIHQNI